MSRQLIRLVAVAGICFIAPLANAATVNYSGRLDNRTVSNAYVVAATFSPTFTDNYMVRYGDPGMNLYPDAYQMAVADGNLIPIGSGTHTTPDGFFSGTGSTSAPDGTNIYLFAFDAEVPIAYFQVIATSTAANWKVSSSDATLLATEPDVFMVGRRSVGGLMLDSVPIPEPTVLLAAAGIGVIGVRRCRRA